MRKSLKERLSVRARDYEAYVNAERLVEKEVDWILSLLPEGTDERISVYSDDAYLRFSVPSIEVFEEIKKIT